MKRVVTLGFAILALLMGVLGLLFSQSQQFCPPGPIGSQCTGLRTVYNLPLLFISIGAIVGGLVALGWACKRTGQWTDWIVNSKT